MPVKKSPQKRSMSPKGTHWTYEIRNANTKKLLAGRSMRWPGTSTSLLKKLQVDFEKKYPNQRVSVTICKGTDVKDVGPLSCRRKHSLISKKSKNSKSKS